MPCSGNVTVWWAVKKEPESFNIYHSNQTFSKNALPTPLETDVDSKVREYHHSRVPYKEDQCYRIGSVKNSKVYPSNGVLVKKLVRTKKAYFKVRSKVFNSHDDLSFTLNVLTRDGQKDIVVDSNSLTFIARSLEDWQNDDIEFDIEDSVEGLVGVYITGEIEPYETDDGVQQDTHQVTICVEALSENDEQTGVILTVDSHDVGVKLPAVTHKANENQTIRFGEDVVSVCLLCKEIQPISCDGATPILRIVNSTIIPVYFLLDDTPLSWEGASSLSYINVLTDDAIIYDSPAYFNYSPDPHRLMFLMPVSEEDARNIFIVTDNMSLGFEEMTPSEALSKYPDMGTSTLYSVYTEVSFCLTPMDACVVDPPLEFPFNPSDFVEGEFNYIFSKAVGVQQPNLVVSNQIYRGETIDDWYVGGNASDMGVRFVIETTPSPRLVVIPISEEDAPTQGHVLTTILGSHEPSSGINFLNAAGYTDQYEINSCGSTGES